jgi:hypothetical protein
VPPVAFDLSSLSTTGLTSVGSPPPNASLRLREDWSRGAHGAAIAIQDFVAASVGVRGVARSVVTLWLRPRDAMSQVSEATFDLDRGVVLSMHGYDGALAPLAETFPGEHGVRNCFIALPEHALPKRVDMRLDIWIRESPRARASHPGRPWRGIDLQSVEAGPYVGGPLEFACARAGLRLLECGFAMVKNYMAARFDQASLQRFIDDPSKHQGSIRDAFEVLAAETGSDCFTLADYSRAAIGAELVNVDTLLARIDRFAAEADALVCRIPLASNAGFDALSTICRAEAAWMQAAQPDPLTTIAPEIVRRSPLLVAGALLARRGVRDAGPRLGRLSADKYCLGGEQFIEITRPDSQRWGALTMRFSR